MPMSPKLPLIAPLFHALVTTAAAGLKRKRSD